ncbi:MAG: type II toxin-antitoxin system HicB family antitoxin [Nitrospira sp.]
MPALPGYLSQGKTHAEAIANVKEAIEGWLEVMFVSSRFGSFSTTSMDESSINSASATSPA